MWISPPVVFTSLLLLVMATLGATGGHVPMEIYVLNYAISLLCWCIGISAAAEEQDESEE